LTSLGWIGQITESMTIVLAIVSIIYMKKMNGALMLVGIYLISESFIEIGGYFSTKLFGINIYLLHINVLFEFVFLGLIFFKLFLSFNRKIPIYWILFIGVPLIILNTLFLQPWNTFNTNSYTVVSGLIIAACIYYFYLSLENKPSEYNTLINRVVAYLLIMHCTSIIIVLFSNLILEIPSMTTKKLFWRTRGAIQLIAKSMLLYALIRYYKNPFKKQIYES